MNNKNGKQKQLKRKARNDDLEREIIAPSLPKKKKKKKKKSKQAAANKKNKMSLKTSSSSHSTNSSMDAQKEDDTEDFSKLQCDLCKLSYGSKDKLKEHLASLMHHTKLEDADKNATHRCVLCESNFKDMSSYRDHIGTKKHLHKLAFLRGTGTNKDKQKTNQKGKPSNQHRRENELDNDEPEYQNAAPYNPHFKNNSRWQEPNYPRGHNFENYNNPYVYHRFGPNNGFNNTRQQQMHQHFPDWKRNGYNKNYNYGPERPHNPGQGAQGFQNHNTMEGNVPWGSGLADYRRSNAYNNNNMKHNNMNFTQNNIDLCWDELSFQQHENFLADMDQGYQRDSVEFHRHQDAPPPHHSNYFPQGGGGRNNGPDTAFKKKSRYDDPLPDRKRPRHDDHPFDPSAKSSKPLEPERDRDNVILNNDIPARESEMLNDPISKTSSQNTSEVVTSPQYKRASYHDKSVLDNASDSILERAERLCKELREKREASSNQRANVLKSQTHNSINDKMNNLKKSKQSYLKGHISNMSNDQVSSGDSTSTISTISSAAALTQKLKEPSIQSKSPSTPMGKTLDEIRKSIEQSVLDDTRSASSAVSQDDKNKSRVRSLSEASNTQSPPNSERQSKGRIDSIAGSDGKHVRPGQKVDSGSGGSKTGSKQPISKENLNKMVNCPRSRTERVQLARMFHSRADSSKSSSAQLTPRSNINLEGLYDSSDLADVEINVGGNMPTIKLEDLSDDVRSQILGLIQDDIGILQSINSEQQSLERVDIDDIGDMAKTATTRREFLVCEKDSSEKKSKKKNSTSKALISKAADIAEAQSHAVNQESASAYKTKKEGFTKLNHLSNGEHAESYRSAKRLTTTASESSKRDSPDKINNLPSSMEQNSPPPRLTKDNVLSKYPTILGTMGTSGVNTEEKCKSKPLSVDMDGKNVDSGRSSMSLSSSSTPTSSMTSSSIPSSGRSSFLSSLSSPNPTTTQPPTTVSASPSALPRRPNPIEEAVNLLSSPPPFVTDPPSDRNEVASTIASSLGSNVSSNTMSELLALSEQEESVKQEMMSMELRLTRLHRLLEQAVHQINKCTDRRNELQDEEKSLTGRRLSLLREATSTSSSTQQESRSAALTSSMALTSTPPSQTNTVESTAALPFRSSSSSLQMSSVTDLPPPPPPPPDSHEPPQSSLSRSEWLAKFSAYLPSGFISSQNNESNRKTLSPRSTSHNDMDQNKNKQGVVSSDVPPTNTSTRTSLSSDPTPLQMVPERDLQPPAIGTESYVRYSTVSRQNSSDPSVPGIQDDTTGDPKPSQEFTSPIMYVGTIKSGSSQRSTNKVAPVMMISNATLSSLFSDLGEDVNPVQILGRGENSIPPVLRRPSIGSPRQEDSDIGSIASVASGSSLGEQISRYCRFTPGASVADGQNPHDLSTILSAGPSDTSDLRGLEDEEEDNFGEGQNRLNEDSSSQSKDVIKLKEDSGNDRLYGRLDQESIKSAEALHLIERNNEAPSSTLDRKKKKRKTKQQRDSGIKGRPKPYIISSSSADELFDANKTEEDHLVSSLEQRMRKSPESTDDDSSDHPNTSGRRLRSETPQRSSCLSPSKGDQGTDITYAECDSSTNLGMVDSQSLIDSSNRLKEMNESFEKTFGRKPRDRSSFYKELENTKNVVVVVSDDNGQEIVQQKETNSDVIDLCDDEDIQPLSSRAVRSLQKPSRYPSQLGPVCFIQSLNDKIFVGYLTNGFKVFDIKSEDSKNAQLFPVSKLSCMAVVDVRDGVRVCLGSGHSVVAVNPMTEGRTSMDMGTTVNCLHILKTHLFAGLDTGEICVYDVKSWKKTDRYLCSDSPIQCMASGTEGGTRVLCVASQDSTITVVDADRCLPLRMLTAHSKAALSVQVYSQYVYSCSGDSKVIIHNLHTARAEQVFQDNTGMVNSVFYSKGYLFTGGLDRLVRVYNVKNSKLVQAYYGAGMGAIKTIYVHEGKLLITGNTQGCVDIVDLDFTAKNVCKHKKCGLNFGLPTHLAWHMELEH